MATNGTLRHLRNGMLVGCAHGALAAVAWMMFAADAHADRTIVIGGNGSRSPGTVVISGSGAVRGYEQVATLPSGGSVQVDLGAIEGGSRIRLRPPGSSAGYAPEGSGNLALRPPSGGAGPIQLAQTPSFAAPQRIVLRPPVPTPRPSRDLAYRPSGGPSGGPPGGTNADTAELNRSQLAEVAPGTLRVSIPDRRIDLQPPSAPQHRPAPLTEDRPPAREQPAREQFAAAPREIRPPDATRPTFTTTEVARLDARRPEMAGLDGRGQDARALNLAVLATVEATPPGAYRAAPSAPMAVTVAPPPAPIGVAPVGTALSEAPRTQAPLSEIGDLRPRTIGVDAAPVTPSEPAGPEPETPPPVATIGVGEPTRRPPQPVAPHQQTAALPPDPTIGTRPTIYWTSPRIDAPPPPAGMPRIGTAPPAIPGAAGAEPPARDATMPDAPQPVPSEQPEPADEPPAAVLPADRYRPLPTEVGAPADPSPTLWQSPAPPRADTPAPPPPLASLPDRPAPSLDTSVYGERPARRYEGLSDRAFPDMRDEDGPLANRGGHPSMPGVPSADVEFTQGGGLIESLMNRGSGAPAAPAAAPAYPRAASAPPASSSQAPLALPAPVPADDAAPQPAVFAEPAVSAPPQMPRAAASSGRRALTPDEAASLAAVGGQPPRHQPAPYEPPVPAVAPPVATAAPTAPGPVDAATITWTSPPAPVEPIAPKPFTPSEASALGAASGRAGAANAPIEPTPDRTRATPQPALPPRAEASPSPAPASVGPSPALPGAVRTPAVAALPEPPVADLDLFGRPATETAPPPNRDEVASLPPMRVPPAVTAQPEPDLFARSAPEPVVALAPVRQEMLALPAPPARLALPAPSAAPSAAPTPTPTIAAAAPFAAAAPATADAGPREYPLLPPPRRPVSADGTVASVEPRPGQGHLELPPDFLPGLRADRASPRTATLASADGAISVPRQPATAPTTDAPATASIVFGAGGTDLPVTADGDVEKVARRLLQDPALRVQVRAYADGADEANKRQVSLHRALSVRSALIDEGVRSTRIAVQALGGETRTNPRDRVDLVVMRS